MSTFITRLDTNGDGPRLAVKDLIDMEGLPTTAGCRAVADRATPAAADAACLAGARAAGARIVGRTNLHELALGTTGVNPWFGTPVNPLDASLLPGGSSSGSAVAVADDEADVALGSDTGGSIRIPSACCGTTGLKTTWGRVPLTGVWPLAPSLDTIGPMARDVVGVVTCMRLIEPGFEPAPSPATTVGRLRIAGADVDPAVDAAVDAALSRAEVDAVDLELDSWADALATFGPIIVREAWEADRHLLRWRDGIGDDVTARIDLGSGVTDDALAIARGEKAKWSASVDALFERVELLALPTLVCLPPRLDDAADMGLRLSMLTSPFNLSGHPVMALPVPSGRGLPASLQLVAPWGGEELLCATGIRVEAAAAVT